MKIFEAQKEILDSFDCVRLSTKESLMRLVDEFKNSKNDHLVDYLQGDATMDDASGKVACYVIIDKDEDILCYFSIKSGILYNEFEEWRMYEQYKKLDLRLSELTELNKGTETQAIINELSTQLEESKKRINQRLGSFDSFPIHKQVATSFSAIELSHFCVNENYKSKWCDFNLGDRNRIGLTLFWHFIIPKVIQVSDLIGCEYLYLFAADGTPDRFLVNHYKNFMGLREDMNVLAIQPIYDFRCTFLCNTISALKDEMCNFYDHFNDNNSI